MGRARGRSAAAGPGAWAVVRPTLHGGPVRLRPVRAIPCLYSVSSILKCFDTCVFHQYVICKWKECTVYNYYPDKYYFHTNINELCSLIWASNAVGILVKHGSAYTVVNVRWRAQWIMAISGYQNSETPEPSWTDRKFGMRDYIGSITRHAKIESMIAPVGLCLQIGEILLLSGL